MLLISLKEIELAFGSAPVLDKVNFQTSTGERVCIIGRNGEGKSSLLNIIARKIKPDSGEIKHEDYLKISLLEQDPRPNNTGTVLDEVSLGLEHNTDKEPWEIDYLVKSSIEKCKLDPNQPLNQLSGGEFRRVAIAKTMVAEPDILLLDEPTNHLDIETIQWLESLCFGFSGAIIFISHDRAFIDKVANRVLELDRGKITEFRGNYQNYLIKKTELLKIEEKENVEFDKKLSQEEKWIRQGIKARRTRNEGRVRALKKLRVEHQARRNRRGSAKLQTASAEKSGKIVIEAKDISYLYEHKPLIQNFSSIIERSDKIAIVGPNGCGKSTLIQILLQKLAPNSGEVKHGTKLEIAYFDQHRVQLDPEKNLMDTVAEGRSFIEMNGKQKHVMSYLQDFLFSPERARSPVRQLSGGERNRLLLARIFSQPSNFLILDEPTNDLDMETIELLEELLLNYAGTILLVSHDRQFMDNVATDVLVFSGNGVIESHVGGYSDWINYQKKQNKQIKPQPKNTPAPKITKKTKLSYKEQKELQNLPRLIEKLENKIEKLTEAISQPDFYQQSQDIVTYDLEQLKKYQSELETAYQRWEELE